MINYTGSVDTTGVMVVVFGLCVRGGMMERDVLYDASTGLTCCGLVFAGRSWRRVQPYVINTSPDWV